MFRSSLFDEIHTNRCRPLKRREVAAAVVRYARMRGMAPASVRACPKLLGAALDDFRSSFPEAKRPWDRGPKAAQAVA